MPIIVILLIITAFIGGSSLITRSNQNPSPVEHISTSPISTPVPTLSETTEKEEKTAVLPTNDPDPIVSCDFKYLGSKQMRNSECSKSFECQVGGQWYIYISQEKCTQDQNKQISQNPGTDWSSYRAARIKDLQGALKIINDSNAKYSQDLEKFNDYLEAITSDYQNGLITYEEFKTRGDKVLPVIKELTSWIQDNQRKRESYETLIRRFESGENVSAEEYKAILNL